MRHELQKTWLSNIGYNDILHATPRLRNQDAPCLWGEQYRTDVALSRQGMNRGMLPSQIPNIGEIYNPSTLNISQPINIAVMGMPGAGKDTAIASLQQSSFSPELIFIDEQYQRAKASGKLPLNDNESLRRSIA